MPLLSALRRSGQGAPTVTPSVHADAPVFPVEPSREALQALSADLGPYLTAPVISSAEAFDCGDAWYDVNAAYDVVRSVGQAQFDKIVAACRSQGKPFFDATFGCDQRDVVFGADVWDSSALKLLVEVPALLRRATAIKPFLPAAYSGNYLASVKGVGVLQAPQRYATKYLADAILVLSRSELPVAMPSLILGAAEDVAVFAFMLYHPIQGWTCVIVDDYVPVAPQSPDEWLYGPSSKHASWPVLLVKALAKLYGSYGALAAKGGRLGEALGDLLGPSFVINELRLGESFASGAYGSGAGSNASATIVEAPPPSTVSSAASFAANAPPPSEADLSAAASPAVSSSDPSSSNVSADADAAVPASIVVPDWAFLQRAIGDATSLVVCEVNPTLNPVVGAFGLLSDVVYIAASVLTTFDACTFVRVRNTCDEALNGVGVWTGAYSLGAPEWAKHPLHVKQLKPERLPCGEFWLTVDDFAKFLGVVTVVRPAPRTDRSLTMSRVLDVTFPATPAGSRSTGVCTAVLATLSRAASATAGPTALVASVAQATLGGQTAADYASIGLTCDAATAPTTATSAVRSIAPNMPLAPGVTCALNLVVKAARFAAPTIIRFRLSVLLASGDAAVTFNPAAVAAVAYTKPKPTGAAAQSCGSSIFNNGLTLAEYITADDMLDAFAEADCWSTGRASRKLAEQAFLGIVFSRSLRTRNLERQHAAQDAFAAAVQNWLSFDLEEFGTVVKAALARME